MNDEDIDAIDVAILTIATGLDKGMSEDKLIQLLLKTNISPSEVHLIIEAGKILHKERQTAPKPKIIFRRVP